jgi:AcrR family transcriptional regulator
MADRQARGDVRAELIEAGVRLVDRDGPQALSARKVATEIGTSTMAVYTHFGDMAALVDAIGDEAFARFAEALNAVPRTNDPVADFFGIGVAYRGFALSNPQHYQLIFGVWSSDTTARSRAAPSLTGETADRTARAASFDVLLNAVRRMIEAGRIRDDEILAIANRLWSLIHGVVMLELAGFLGHEGRALADVLSPVVIDVLVGMGDERDAATHSIFTGSGRLRRSKARSKTKKTAAQG